MKKKGEIYRVYFENHDSFIRYAHFLHDYSFEIEINGIKWFIKDIGKFESKLCQLGDRFQKIKYVLKLIIRNWILIVHKKEE